MVGVLIRKQPGVVRKVPENSVPLKPLPKKLARRVKKTVSSKKPITVSRPLVEQPVVTEVVNETEQLDELAKVEQVAVLAPRSDAEHLNNRAPVYPRASLRRHEEGKVILELLVQADGTVGEIRVKESSGYQRLDQAAIKAVRRWHYVPARQGDDDIDFWYQQPLLFKVRK